jgi:histidyl-tRNA synthetase
MNDILPPESARWEWFEDHRARVMRRYGYRNIRTPIVEPTQLFVRGLGEVTDIVEKEMYSFEDRMNGDHLTLRPKAPPAWCAPWPSTTCCTTAASACTTSGPMFRHERPQRGRYRQFHQVGAEALGFGGPEVDAEVILMARSLWRDLGSSDVRLELNSLGQPDERRAHRAALIAYFEAHADQLDEEARAPPAQQPAAHPRHQEPGHAGAGRSRAEADGLPGRGVAEALRCRARPSWTPVGAEWRINPRLVRGMDYYNLTVFEWVTDRARARRARSAAAVATTA